MLLIRKDREQGDRNIGRVVGLEYKKTGVTRFRKCTNLKTHLKKQLKDT